MLLQFPSIYPVTCHTNHVGPQSTFIAIQGMQSNGVDYIAQALERGATTIVCEQGAVIPPEVMERMQEQGVMLIRVDNTRRALAELSAQAAGYPAKKLKIIGITGTKGKTTSAFLLEHLLRTAGYKTALLGTVQNRILDNNFGTGLTTQQPDYLHQFFALCVEAGVDYVVMEVAAQGLSLHRVHGLEFDGVIFTNFSQEHGEFYPTIEDYFQAKCAIFGQVKKDAPVLLNAEDVWCRNIVAGDGRIVHFGLQNSDAHVRAVVPGQATQGIQFTLNITDHSLSEKVHYSIACPSLLGTFNIYNALGVAGLAYYLGISCDAIAQAYATFSRVPGRMERYGLPNGAQCIIDYAHNPSSYESVLSTLRPLTDNLIVVFGCGGDRDVTKRPIMGSIAAKYADLVVLTSDNPRSENPTVIMNAIKAGIGSAHQRKVAWYPDRKEAIEYAYAQSKATSLIALLGKGPDEYQIVGTVKTYFSEVAIVRALGSEENRENPA